MKLIALASGLFFVAGNAMASVKTCQTAAEIKAHVETSAPEEFCFHKVENPAVGMASGEVIPGFNQLKANLEIAFLNTKKEFDNAQASCTSLGAGWHAPASNAQYAHPRANDNTNSLEAVGEYFATPDYWFWSSSTISTSDGRVWNIVFVNGAIGFGIGSTDVVCVRP